MGWGDCGHDKDGRPIGYLFNATCDQPGCDTPIDRGLSYACGGMHGQTEDYCDKYFCSEHMHLTEDEDVYQLCEKCLKGFEDDSGTRSEG